MVMYREVCPEGVQNKCPGGVWCRDFMSWGDTLILVISRGVQLYYGIAHCFHVQAFSDLRVEFNFQVVYMCNCIVLNIMIITIYIYFYMHVTLSYPWIHHCFC